MTDKQWREIKRTDFIIDFVFGFVCVALPGFIALILLKLAGVL